MDINKLDERDYKFQAVSAFDGYANAFQMYIFFIDNYGPSFWFQSVGRNRLAFSCRFGIKEGVNWLVDAMGRSKRTEMLRLRVGTNVV